MYKPEVCWQITSALVLCLLTYTYGGGCKKDHFIFYMKGMLPATGRLGGGGGEGAAVLLLDGPQHCQQKLQFLPFPLFFKICPELTNVFNLKGIDPRYLSDFPYKKRLVRFEINILESTVNDLLSIDLPMNPPFFLWDADLDCLRTFKKNQGGGDALKHRCLGEELKGASGNEGSRQ